MSKRTTEPRSEYIKLHTDRESKQRLEDIAKARGWSLSLLCHEILQAWLNEKSLAWADTVGDDDGERQAIHGKIANRDEAG